MDADMVKFMMEMNNMSHVSMMNVIENMGGGDDYWELKQTDVTEYHLVMVNRKTIRKNMVGSSLRMELAVDSWQRKMEAIFFLPVDHSTPHPSPHASSSLTPSLPKAHTLLHISSLCR